MDSNYRIVSGDTRNTARYEPYPEFERVAHNERVAAGDWYAEILTLDEMLDRFTYLAEGNRVFDQKTLKIRKLADFKSAYTSSITLKGRKVVSITKLWLSDPRRKTRL